MTAPPPTAPPPWGGPSSVFMAGAPPASTQMLLLIVVRFRIHNRPACFRVDAFCPCNLRKRLSRNERPRDAIQNVIKTVLIRLHDDLTLAAIDHQIREYESLDAVVIPGIAWHRLVIPLQLACVRLNGENRTHKQVVFAFRLAKLFRPWTTVTRSDIYEIRIGIVSHAVPNGSTPAELPPLSGPCLCCLFQRRILEWFRRIARNRIEAPCELSGIRVVCCEKSADRELGTAHADDHLALCDPRRHRDRVTVLGICDARFPNRFTCFGIQSFESAIDHRRDDFPLISCNAAIHNTATDLRPHSSLIDFRIPSPSFLPCAGIDGKNNTPIRDSV